MLHFPEASAVCCKNNNSLIGSTGMMLAGRGGSQNSLQRAVDEGCSRVGDAQCQVWEAERNASSHFNLAHVAIVNPAGPNRMPASPPVCVHSSSEDSSMLARVSSPRTALAI